MNDDDLKFMDLALGQAQKALDIGEVPVGCVFVRNGQVIGSGHNLTNRSLNGTRHAELCAIDEILTLHTPEIFQDTDLYVTVEPCIMCASALRQVRLRRVFFGAGNERFGGCGSVVSVNRDTPSEALGEPYPVYPNLRRMEAVMLLRQFYTKQNPTAPQPKVKKQRLVKDDVPPLDFQLYLSEDQFLAYYGREYLDEYRSGSSVLPMIPENSDI